MLHRLRLFLKSIGRFSPGSFLYPLYGCGDLAPGFVRSSAVKGGIFILDWNPKGIVMQKMKYHDVFGKKGFVFCGNDGIFVVIRKLKTEAEETVYQCLNLVDKEIKLFDADELEIMYDKKEIVAFIGRRFISGYVSECDESCKYEVESMNMVDDENIIIRCLLQPQIALIQEMHEIPKCVYLELHQLLHVKWINYAEDKQNKPERTENIDDAIDHQSTQNENETDDHKSRDNEEVDAKSNDNEDETVTRCTGIITAANQFIKTRYFVGAADYFKDTIESVSVKHVRMTVISDGPILGTLLNETKVDDSDDDSDSDSDSDDSDKEQKNETDNNKKQTVSEKSNCCVVHIPPNTKPFNNEYSIHIIQLDHYSCTVPPPLCLTFFWMQCGDKVGDNIENARKSLQNCYDIFYRKDIIVDDNEEKRPLGLMRSIYEQRIRKVNTDKFADNVFIVKDLSDTIGYENAVQSAKLLFKKMFPNDPWMEKDKPIQPKQTRADKVFSALADDTGQGQQNENDGKVTENVEDKEKNETSEDASKDKNDQTQNNDNDGNEQEKDKNKE